MRKLFRILFVIGLLLCFGTVGAGDEMETSQFLIQAGICLGITLLGFFGGRVYE